MPRMLRKRNSREGLREWRSEQEKILLLLPSGEYIKSPHRARHRRKGTHDTADRTHLTYSFFLQASFPKNLPF